MKPKPAGTKIKYLVLDARGWYDPEEAAVLVACDSRAEVKNYKEDFPSDSYVEELKWSGKDSPQGHPEYLATGVAFKLEDA